MSSKDKKLKLFVSDVDGTLTNGKIYMDIFSNEIIGFSRIDGNGFQLLKNNKIKTAFISSENSIIYKERASKLDIDYALIGVQSKIDELYKICKKENILLNQVAVIGDDINDIEILEKALFKACPNNANKKVKDIKDIYICEKKGGDGCVREFIEYLIEGWGK